MYNIRFQSQNNAFQPVLIKGVPAGYSVAEVAEESDIYLHHNCGMMCACSSCHVYIDAGAEFLQSMSDREEAFLERTNDPDSRSRLGCQSVLIDGEGYLEVTIPNQENL